MEEATARLSVPHQASKKTSIPRLFATAEQDFMSDTDVVERGGKLGLCAFGRIGALSKGKLDRYRRLESAHRKPIVRQKNIEYFIKDASSSAL